MNNYTSLTVPNSYYKIKVFLRFFICLLIISILSLLHCFFFAYTITSNKPSYALTTDAVNFRTYPNTTSRQIKTIAKNTTVKIVGVIDGFSIVQLGTNEVGVISTNYLKTSSNALTSAKKYTSIGKISATITQDGVNFRRGPSTAFTSISKLNKGDIVTAIGSIGSWYMVVSKDSAIGMVYEDYISLKSSATTNNDTVYTSNTDITTILDLINEARKKANVGSLTLGVTSTKVAQLKAEDMVKNEYFAHNSVTYGSPFKMLSDYGIRYKAAGENIAGNPSITAAVKAWLNSSTHRKNLLSPAYNYVGIGIAKSSIYGYIIVTEFVGQ